MGKFLTELIGTFFLVLTIGMTVIAPGAGDLAPLAIGSALMVMIFAGGYISGAHYNPAVTLAVFIRGRCNAGDILPYWIAQIIGAALASAIVLFMKGNPAVEVMVPDVTRALIAEFLYTFALCYVVLNVADGEGHERQSHLRSGDRVHGAGRRLFGWLDLGRRVQSRGGSRDHHHGPVVGREHLDLSRRQPGRRHGGGVHLPRD